jgi:hypothetical protein
MRYEPIPRKTVSTMTDAELTELYDRLQRAERTIVDTEEIIAAAIRRLGRGRG